MKNKAVFFDRDGTLIIDKHYLSNPDDVVYFDDTFHVLKTLQERGYLLFIVTNQSGIGRGFFSESEMHQVHQKMLYDFQKEGIEIKDIVFCPHSPEDNCDCRKPHPRLINELCEKYQVDPTKSFMIGDKDIDAECGINANMGGIKLTKGVNLNSLLTLIH